jgi:hypothetical protein
MEAIEIDIVDVLNILDQHHRKEDGGMVEKG